MSTFPTAGARGLFELLAAAVLTIACGTQDPPRRSSSSDANGGATATGGGSTPTGGATANAGGASAAAGTFHGGAGGTSGSAGSGAGGEGGSGESTPDPSAEIFDAERVPEFSIELSPESIAALGADPDTYVPGTFRYGSETLTEIGVRLKGEGSFRQLDRKAAFKLKFDAFVQGQSFHGLKRLTLNNMVEDPSFLAERLAYHVFRAAGLPAPRCNSALVAVNGEPYGVYANVETEDKPFLRRWFASDEGNLYEEGQQDFVPGAETAFDLETNEAANDRSDLVNLIAVFQGASAATFIEDLDAALDMAHFLRFTAAEAAVNQWDMYAYTVFYPNNFRLYNDPTSAKFVFLPWGMDMSMKPFRDSGKPHIAIFGLARRGDRPQSPVTAGLIFQRCLESQSCRAEYARVVAEIVNVYESAGLETLAERYYEQIRNHVYADPRREYTNDQFERGYESLLSTIRERPAAIRAEL